MDITRLKATLEKQEDRRYAPYLDGEGYVIVGVGLNLTTVGYKGKKYDTCAGFTADYPNGLTDAEIDVLVDEKIDTYSAGVQKLCRQKDVDWDALSDLRREVLVNFGFNLGLTGIVGFPSMWRHLASGDYQNAALQMLEGSHGNLSDYCKQTKMRAVRLAFCMATNDEKYLGLD